MNKIDDLFTDYSGLVTHSDGSEEWYMSKDDFKDAITKYIKQELYTEEDLKKAINLAQDPITIQDKVWGLYNVYRTVDEIIEQINLEKENEEN